MIFSGLCSLAFCRAAVCLLIWNELFNLDKIGMSGFLLKLVLILVLCGGCFAAVEIDQSQTGITNGVTFEPGSWHGQSFEPNMPWLFAVELKCYPNQYVKGSFVVEIWQRRATVSGYGDGEDPRVGTAPLLSAILNEMDTSWNQWVRWEFVDGLDVSSYIGQKLLILFRAESEGIPCYLDTRNLYEDGDRYWIQYTDNSDPNQWYWHHYIDNHDLTFRTFSTEGKPAVCGDPGTVYKQGDVNKDCRVDYTDLDILCQSWLLSSI